VKSFYLLYLAKSVASFHIPEMPSFLSKVFGRKKQDENDDLNRPSDVSLLEGKFEAISPTVSPTANNFLEIFGKDKEKDGNKPKYGRNRSLGPLDELPHLTLKLPDPNEGLNVRPLGVVFEADPTSQIVLSDNEIGKRMLTPSEALTLVNACSFAIIERGWPS
jgi:hypothetical protein